MVVCSAPLLFLNLRNFLLNVLLLRNYELYELLWSILITEMRIMRDRKNHMIHLVIVAAIDPSDILPQLKFHAFLGVRPNAIKQFLYYITGSHIVVRQFVLELFMSIPTMDEAEKLHSKIVRISFHFCVISVGKRNTAT